nr:GAF domain-containing sensor histidine kinase [Oculatella sp. LEGE 06141]
MDTPPDKTFDRITYLAAQILQVPIALVNIVDYDRIWFKSCWGLEGVEQIERDPGLCASVILQDEAWIVTDASTDPRTQTNPLVTGEFGLRFYLGIPLKTKDSFNLGTLCVVDQKPRQVVEEKVKMLQELAAIVVDELELRLATRQVVQSKDIQLTEVERLSQLKDSFLSTISHELRAPITNMKAAIAMLKVAKTETKRNQYLQVLEQECSREAQLIDNLLNLQQLEAGNLEPQPETIELAGWLKELLRPFEARLQRRQQRLMLEIPEHLSLTTDPSILQRIVIELINNACKYSPLDATIAVTVASSMDAAAQPVIELQVKNTGVEIPPQEQQQIFAKFYRIPQGDRWQQGGTGLGLALVKQSVEALQGTIQAQSADNQVTFSVVLPHLSPRSAMPE